LAAGKVRRANLAGVAVLRIAWVGIIHPAREFVVIGSAGRFVKEVCRESESNHFGQVEPV
jgi:hypothetical protein